MRHLSSLAAWVGALVVLLWRKTCRYRYVEDPRPALRAEGRAYVYALLHAHQVAALFVNDEKALAVMVSRSTDGDLLVPSLTLQGVVAVRGSTRRRGKDKGGRKALAELIELSRKRVPVALAVDGPLGPRNHVFRGIVDLALATGAAILPILVLPSRRWFLLRTWDRFQIPTPFSTIRFIFDPPILPEDVPEAERLRTLTEERLLDLEGRYDPEEAARAQPSRA